MTRDSDRIEQAILGSMIVSPDAIVEVFDAGVQAEHFGALRHQHIYRAIESLADRGLAVDLVTVEDRLRELGLVAEIGGHEYLQDLYDVLPTTANTPHYIKRLREHHRKRTRAANVEKAGRFLQEGHVELAAHTLTEPVPASDSRKLHYEDFWKVEVDTARKPLVDEVVGYGETGVIYGASGAGKSFFASDLAFHVANGWPWYGRTTSQGAVVYVAAEAANSMRLRFLALATHYKHLRDRPVPLRLVPEYVNFIQGDRDVRSLINLVKQPVNGVPVTLLILDTLAALIPGGDENDFQSMSALTSQLDLIKRETGATVVVIHHSGKTESKGARGHSSLKCNVDFMLEVRREDDNRVAILEKVRDGEDGKRFGFQLVPVEVGKRFDGAPKQVPIVVHLSAEQTRRPPEGRNRDALHVLVSLLVASPQGVTVDDWRESFVNSMTGQLKPKAARDTHHRAVRLLDHWIVVRDGLIKLRVNPDSAELQRDSSIRSLPCSSERAQNGEDSTKTATSRKTAPEAAATTATTELQSYLSLVPKPPSYNSYTTLKGCSVVAASGEATSQDTEEAEAKARIESLRPQKTTQEESDQAFDALVSAKTFKPEDLP